MFKSEKKQRGEGDNNRRKAKEYNKNSKKISWSFY